MIEAELLFTQILNCDRLSLYTDRARKIAKEEAGSISSALRRRLDGEPIQYILGKNEFMGLEFKVTPEVLIPRPETELLTEKAIEIVTRSGVHKAIISSILDLGTGSGCVAVSLAKFLPGVQVTATDISGEALAIARENADLNNVTICFLKGDLFNTCKLQPAAYDLIVSNPPYIPSAEIDKLQAEIQYEPRIALDGGEDGLDFYRRIIPQAKNYLIQGGFLVMEMGYGQGGKIKNIFNNSGHFEIIEVVKDYNNIERVIVAKLWID